MKVSGVASLRHSPRLFFFFLLAVLFFYSATDSFAAKTKIPITIDGDTVEFMSGGKEVLAEGGVVIHYQDSRLKAERIRVYLDLKLAVAEGNVSLLTSDGEELSGEKIVFDFGRQTGTVLKPNVKMAPFYGGADLMERISGGEILLHNGAVSTCDLPVPHYKMTAEKIRMVSGQTVTAKGMKLSVLGVPLMYFPRYTHDVKDPRPRLMIIPGSSKEFGLELLGSYRYYLNDHLKGRLFLDWYQKKGWGHGLDFNYNTGKVGTGNFKYYRIDEEDTRSEVAESVRQSDERSRLELRHRWSIDKQTNLVLEYFRESDAAFRKDYFFREYEKETNPKTFLLVSRVFPQATLSFLGEPRINEFQTVTQKLPELKLETVNSKILDSPFYFKNTTSVVNFSHAPANTSVTNDVARADTSNQVSYVFRWMNIDFSPFAGHRDTFYTRDVMGIRNLHRGIFFGGVDMSSKFFKIFDVETNAFGLDIQKLRHVVTPSLRHSYRHDPTLASSRLYQLDEIDALDDENRTTLSLENKLQTKRDGVSVDLVRLIVSADYNFTRASSGSGFENVRYDLELRAYENWSFDTEGEFDTTTGDMKDANTDLWAHMGKAHSALGYRFKRDESSQLTAKLDYILNPFWKVGVYERFEFSSGDLIEQEYRLERDMHCWIMEFIVNSRQDEGVSFLVAFKLKAFPEIGFDAQKTFHPPRSEENPV